MRTVARLWITLALLLAGCAVRTEAPTDQALIEQLEADRSGFERIIELMSAAPVVQRVERRRDGSWVILPVGADQRRVEAVRDFMAVHDISSVARKPSARTEVWFVMFEGQGAGKTYQSKTLIFGEPGESWRLVADSDTEMSRFSPDAYQVVFRNAGDGWYIRTSCDC